MLITIIGKSGSGKTTIAEALATSGIPTIHSYTTRPMRPGEQQGREHIFVSDDEARRLLATQRPLAYTHFGGYHYFALWSQIFMYEPAPWAATRFSPPSAFTYVIDEAGFASLTVQTMQLRTEMQDAYHLSIPVIDLLPVLIERDETAIAATIPADRRQRDQGREAYADTIPYRIIIRNDAPDTPSLVDWVQHQLAPALNIWLNYAPDIHNHRPTRLTTSMTTAQIIAALHHSI